MNDRHRVFVSYYHDEDQALTKIKLTDTILKICF